MGLGVRLKVKVDADTTIRAIKRIQTLLPHVVESAVQKACEYIEKEEKATILDQMVSWPPLSEKYLQRKIAQGLDSRILVATSNLVGSISTEKIRRSKDGIIGTVTIKPNRYKGRSSRKNTGRESRSRTADFIAFIHEYTFTPRRPFINPTYQRVKKEVENIIQNAIGILFSK